MASRSPTAATPLPKSSVAPESPFKETNAALSSQPVSFPPPQTFEIIPQLHGILLRLLSQKPAGSVAIGGSGDNAEVPGTSIDTRPDGQQPSSSIPGGEGNGPTASQTIAETTGSIPLDSTAHPPLDVKNLPTETHSIKIRIQKARAVVEGLPDMQRSVEDQEHEISELEDRVSRLRSAISDFGTRAGQDLVDHPKATAV